MFAALSIVTGCAAPYGPDFPVVTASPAAEVDGVEVVDIGPDDAPSRPPNAVSQALNAATKHAEKSGEQSGHPYLAANGAVVLTATSPDSLDVARRYAKHNSKLAGVSTEYRVVKNSFAKLEKVRRDLELLPHDAFPGSQIRAWIDPKANRVMLQSTDASRETVEGLLAKYGPDTVTLVYSPIDGAYPAS